MIVGIDPGTTNRACAIWRNDAPVLVPNAPGDYPTPSAVGIGGDDAVLVGGPHPAAPDRKCCACRRVDLR